MKKEKTLRIGAYVSVLLLVILSFVFMHPSSSFNAAKAAGSSYTVASTIEITQLSSTAALALSVNNPEGTFAYSAEDARAKFLVSTNNYTGYTMTITGDDDGELKNNSAHTAIGSIDTSISALTFNSSSYNGKWGLFPNKYHGTDNTNFVPAPTSSPTILDVTNSPNTLKTGAASNSTSMSDLVPNEYTIGVGVRAGFATAAGTYASTFNIGVVGNPIAYAITYSDNTGDSNVKNLPPTQSSLTSEQTVILSSTTPTRNNYSFIGWCYGTASNNGMSCSGETFHEGDAFSLDQTADNVIALYAMWSPNIAVKTDTGISNIRLNGTDCNTSVDPQASTIGCVIKGLKYNQSYALSITLESGFQFSSWSTSASGSFTDASSATTNFTVGNSPTTITATLNTGSYTIGLVNSGATTSGSTSTTVTYKDSYSVSVTNPRKEHSVSGFSTSYNNASGASVSSYSTLYNSYTFNGWYTSDSGGTKVIDSSGQLMPNTAYTDAYGRWAVTYGATLYAQWGSGSSVHLPTISKSGHTCGWSTSSNTSYIQYSSGYSSLVPSYNMTLYGVCNVNVTYHTCYKQYRLQYADGSFPSSYSSDGSESIASGNTCYYSKSLTDYKSSASASNGSTASTSGSVGSSDIYLYLDMYRNTYSLSVDKNSYISSVSGAGTYRWGDAASISASPSSGNEFDYWSQSGTSGSFGNSSSSSTTFTMGKGSATVTANGKAGSTPTTTYIQDVTSSTCTTTPQTVYDKRDGQSYIIQKLSDNRCWMMTNLNLGASSISVDLTSSNTNISSSITASTFNKWIKSNNATVTSYDYTVPALIPVSGSDSTAKAPYGTLYNFCAASGKTVCSYSNSSNASYDLCPSGWHLPTGSNGEFRALYNAHSALYGTTKIFDPVSSGGLAFTLSGTFTVTSMRYSVASQGSLSNFWSPTRSTSSTMYVAHFTPSGVGLNASGEYDRQKGASIRCILK